MSKYTIVTCIVLVSLAASLMFMPYVNAASTTWSKTYGGSLNDRAFSLIKTQDGGYALLGTSMSFSSSGLVNALLLTTDANGNLQWNQTYAGLGAAYPDALIQTTDGGYAIAGYTYVLNGTSVNPWLAKTDAVGNLQWNKTYAELGNLIGNLVQAPDGGYVLVGYTTVSEDFVQAWLAKTDAEGNVQWKQNFGTSGDNELYCIIQTDDGGFVLGGYTTTAREGLEDFWLIKTDLSGSIIWNHTYGGSGYDILGSFVQTDDGGFALFGYSNSTDTGNEDYMLVKTDSSGMLQWIKTYGETNIDLAFSGIQTADGGYALTGVTVTSSESGNAMLVKTDAEGNMLWSQIYGNSNDSVLYAIVQADDGGYVLAGYTNSSSTYQDFWLIKTDGNGTIPSPSVVSPSPTIPEFTGLIAVVLIAVCTAIITLITKKRVIQKIR